MKKQTIVLFILLSIFSALQVASFQFAFGEEEKPKYTYSPFKPVFYPNESLDYKLTSKGIPAGYLKFWTGAKPEKGKPYELNFRAKCNRLANMNIPFLSFEFFNSKALTMQNTEDGSSIEFTRYLDRDKQFLDEQLWFDYERLEVKQRITKNRDIRPFERFHLLKDKMLDPLSVIYHLRAVKLTKEGEKRSYHVFADGFWDITLVVKKQKKAKYGDLGERKAWVVEMTFSRPWLLFYTGDYYMEIDVETGIILMTEWKTSKGKCKAVLESGSNSPLPFPALQ